MSAAAPVLGKESSVSSETNPFIQIGDHLVNTADGSQVEFITEAGETILVNIRPHVQGHPRGIARAFLVGDDSNAHRPSVFHNYAVLPAASVYRDGKIVRHPDHRVVESNGIGYYAQGNRLVFLYPAVYVHNDTIYKDSPSGYRSLGRSRDAGVVIKEIRVIVLDTEALPA